MGQERELFLLRLGLVTDLEPEAEDILYDVDSSLWPPGT